MSLSWLASSLALVVGVQSIRIPLHSRDMPPHSTAVKINGSTTNPYGFANNFDAWYSGTIQISGQSFAVSWLYSTTMHSPLLLIL